jgi:hypothetical protein
MNTLFVFLRDQMLTFWKQLREQRPETGYLPLLRPVAPYDSPDVFSPLSAIGVLLALIVTSGIALGAMAILLAALLALYFLMTEVLGITVELRPLRP